MPPTNHRNKFSYAFLLCVIDILLIALFLLVHIPQSSFIYPVLLYILMPLGLLLKIFFGGNWAAGLVFWFVPFLSPILYFVIGWIIDKTLFKKNLPVQL